jgi:two-component system sensor histidine kinase UhpB
MPLRRRLLVLIALVLCLSLMIGGVLTYWNAVRKIDTEMSSAVQAGESTVKDTLGSLSELAQPERQLEMLIASFDDERHLQASLVAPGGTIAKKSNVNPPADPAPQWLYRLVAGPQRTVQVMLPAKLASLGHIELRSDSTNEVSEVWEDVKLKLTIIASFFSLVLALVYWALGQALRPLENLSAGLARIGKGDYAAHVSESGPTELAAIYREFNNMADQLQASEERNQRLNEQLLTVQEEERADIARDLHDEIGPFLFAVDVDAQTVPQLLDRGATGEVIERTGAIRQSVAHMQSHLRSILSRLKPAVLSDLGLAHAVEQMTAFWSARNAQLTFDIDIPNESFGTKLDETIYRILQEAVSNAVRHGNPDRVGVSVKRTARNEVIVTVSDNGSGLEPKTLKGFGLPGMRERLAALGGTLSVTGNEAKPGVNVIAVIPCEGQAAKSGDERPSEIRTI